MEKTSEYRTFSAEETEKVGAALARSILGGAEHGGNARAFVALGGELGVGKTAFVRGMASVIAPSAAVRSPTYTLCNVYRSPGGENRLCHFDLYRLGGEDDLESTGFYDYTGVIAVEWYERVPSAVPADAVFVTIRRGAEDDERIIVISRRG